MDFESHTFENHEVEEAALPPTPPLHPVAVVVEPPAMDRDERRRKVDRTLSVVADNWSITSGVPLQENQFPLSSLKSVVAALAITESADIVAEAAQQRMLLPETSTSSQQRLAAASPVVVKPSVKYAVPETPLLDRSLLSAMLTTLPYRQALSPTVAQADTRPIFDPVSLDNSQSSPERRKKSPQLAPSSPPASPVLLTFDRPPRLAVVLQKVIADYEQKIELLEDDMSDEGNALINEFKSIINRGVDQTVIDIVRMATSDLDTPMHLLLQAFQVQQAKRMDMSADSASTANYDPGASTGAGSRRSTHKSSVAPFVSALAITHLSRSPTSPWRLDDVALLFIDISGYSSVAAALCAERPFELSAAVNSYFAEILAVVYHAGGDVLKFAGDAILVAWHSRSLSPQQRLRAAAACALDLVESHGKFEVTIANATFGIHVGLAQGSLTSRILCPSAESNQTAMPMAFHFLTGKPLSSVTRACAAAERGELVITRQCLSQLTDVDCDRVRRCPVFNPAVVDPAMVADAERLRAAAVSVRIDELCTLRIGMISDRLAKEASAEFDGDAEQAKRNYLTIVGMVMPQPAMPAEPGLAASIAMPRGRGESREKYRKLYAKPAARPTTSIAALPLYRQQGNALASCTRGATTKEVAGDGIVVDELLFVPPRISEQLGIGSDPLMMAQNRDLVILFVRMGSQHTDPHSVAGTVDPTVWFEEVHGVLRRNGGAVVQVIDDDKGVHCIAAFNMYSIAHDAGDRCIAAMLELRDTQSESYAGAAAGRVFCGVLGAKHACQWDITGSAVVRACRLMQHAVEVFEPVVFDETVYSLARDKSSLAVLPGGSIKLKGTPEPVPCYCLVPPLTHQPSAMTPSSGSTMPGSRLRSAIRAATAAKTFDSCRKQSIRSRSGSFTGPKAQTVTAPTPPPPPALAVNNTAQSAEDFEVSSAPAGSPHERSTDERPATAPGFAESMGHNPLKVLPGIADMESPGSPGSRVAGTAAASANGVDPFPHIAMHASVNLGPSPSQHYSRSGTVHANETGLPPPAVNSMTQPQRQSRGTPAPKLYFAHTLSTYVHEGAIAAVRNVILHGHNGRHTVVLRGPCTSGKFSVILNAVEQTGFVPVVHASEDGCTSGSLLRSIATWFAASVNRHVSRAAQEVLTLLANEHQTAAHEAGIDLVRTLVARKIRVAIVVRRVQFLDAGSLSLLVSLHELFSTSKTLAILITCYPLFGVPRPHTLFGLAEQEQPTDEEQSAADGALHLVVETVARSERLALVCHSLEGRCEESLVDWICERSADVVGYTRSLCHYLLAKNALSLSASGTFVAKPRALRAVESVSWVDIAPKVTVEVMQMIDRLSPQLLMLVKIVAAITEQAGVTAFAYAVNRSLQVMLGHDMDMEEVRNLQSIYILRSTIHRCSAHKSDENAPHDAALFYIAPMRDIVAGILTPQQRAQINAICVKAYADTHPMNHPMQHLVRARHALFAGELEQYMDDMEAGWHLIDHHSELSPNERERLRRLYFEWIGDVPPDRVLTFVSERDRRKYQAIVTSRLSSAATGVLAARSNSDNNSLVETLSAAQKIQTLSSLRKTLSLGPARDFLDSIIQELSVMHECVNDAAARQELIRSDPATPAAPNESTPLSLDRMSILNLGAVEEIVTIPPAVMQRYMNALRDYLIVLGNQSTPMWSDAIHSDSEIEHNNRIAELVKNTADSVTAEIEHVKAMTSLVSSGTPTSISVERAREFVSREVDLIHNHVMDGMPVLCNLFEGHAAEALLFTASDMAAEITSRQQSQMDGGHKAYHISRVPVRSGEDEVADGIQHVLSVFGAVGGDLSQDTSMVVTLYSHLPQINAAYCPSSTRLAVSFVEGLRSFYAGLLGMEADHRRIRSQFLVFTALWITCCREVTLFR